MPGKEGLVRIGELADYRVPSVEDVVNVGDEIEVMVLEIDNLGRINLSRRAVLDGTESEELEVPGEIPSPMARRSSMLTTVRPPQRAPRPAGDGGGFNRRRGGRGRGGPGGGGGGAGSGGRRPPRPGQP